MDLVLTAARFTKLEARWLRLFLLLGGDIEVNPGPSRKQATPRGPLDMSVGFAPATSGRMTACVAAFEKWLWEELNVQLPSIAWDTVAAPLALRAYGMFLFSAGAPRGLSTRSQVCRTFTLIYVLSFLALGRLTGSGNNMNPDHAGQSFPVR